MEISKNNSYKKYFKVNEVVFAYSLTFIVTVEYLSGK